MRNPHAVALGRLGGIRGGSEGGRTRTAASSRAERREFARQAADARWGKLPERLRPLFWTYPTTFETLNIADHLDLVMVQVLAAGGPEHKRWLVRRFGDEAIRRWIIRKKGKGLTLKQMIPWVSVATARGWQAGNPGAAIWEER